jgi:hypothetical protein
MNNYIPVDRGFIMRGIKPFYAWIQDNGMNITEVRNLPENKRRSLFNKWKHGLNSDEANENVEQTKHYTMSCLSEGNLSAMKPFTREYFLKEIRFEGMCNEYRGGLGIKKLFLPNITAFYDEIKDVPSGREQTLNPQLARKDLE